MGLTADVSLILALMLPFAAAALAPLLYRLTGSLAAWVLAAVPGFIFVVLLHLVPAIATGESLAIGMDWIPDQGLRLSFLVDGLSLTFALTISGVGALIILYSGAYLGRHPHLGRFLGFMLAFIGAMLGLVLADNLIALFVFWEATSIASFLLIGFEHTRQAARRAAIQALVVTNIGGLALLVAAILLHQIGGSWEISGLTGDIRGHGLYGAVLVLVLLAAFTKSAQFPLHFWLPNAMEAPTPVSAFLHSATMVQGGVYLLARLSPVLGGTEPWTASLVGFGAVTLMWGAVWAMRQTDLKQMLAQTTIASLGLLVLLIGLGSETAALAMVLYFAAHALYKACLFLVVGAIDHETGTRDITLLSGLRDNMPVTFISSAAAGLSMFGAPLTLGFFAKEEMYLALTGGQWQQILVLAVLVIGNALLAGVGLTIAARPFLGPEAPTPRPGHEAPIAMLVGPLLLGTAGFVAYFLIEALAGHLLAPASSAIIATAVESHLSPVPHLGSIAFWLSVVTWAIAVLVYWQLAAIRSAMRRAETFWAWTLDRGFDSAMFGLIRLAGGVTRLLHHGRLEIYLFTLFACLALALLAPFLAFGGLDLLMPTAELGDWSAKLAWPPLRAHEWAVLAMAVVGLGALLTASNRLVAILSLGIQGTAVALVFLMFGAPDLAFTQFMVEILSVVILALVMTRLNLDERDTRPFEDLARDGILALACGVGVTLLLLVVLAGPLDTRLSDFFTATSVPIAHGHNIVNVILVDYRGLDTLGEISVVMGAGIAVLALLRRRGSRGPAITGGGAS